MLRERKNIDFLIYPLINVAKNEKGKLYQYCTKNTALYKIYLIKMKKQNTNSLPKSFTIFNV